MDVEDHLARFRPVLPPARLREQVLEACRRGRRSPWRPWPFVAAAAALLLLAFVNTAIEERLSAKMPPVRSPPPDASPVLQGLSPDTLSRLFVLAARADPASAQSFIRLRLQMGRSES